MGRSKTSEPEHSPAAALPEQYGQLRYRGAAGGYIAEHRAFSTLAIGWPDLVAAAVLAVGLTALWLSAASAVCSLWAHILNFWQQALALPAHVAVNDYRLGSSLHWPIPYLTLEAVRPDRAVWAGSIIATLSLFAGSYRLPREALPLIYLLRLVSVVQASSLLYFGVAPAAFPHALSDYMADMLAASLALMSTVPALLGFTYYLFPFSLLQKVGLTVMILGLLTLVVPLQYLLQTCFLYQCSLLWMPLFYMVLGLPLEVMLIIALYGWGMSWDECRPTPRRAVRRRPHRGTGEFPARSPRARRRQPEPSPALPSPTASRGTRKWLGLGM